MAEMTEGRKCQIAESVIHRVLNDLDFADIASAVEQFTIAPKRNDLLDIARLVWNADIDVVLRTDD